RNPSSCPTRLPPERHRKYLVEPPLGGTCGARSDRTTWDVLLSPLAIPLHAAGTEVYASPETGLVTRARVDGQAPDDERLFELALCEFGGTSEAEAALRTGTGVGTWPPPQPAGLRLRPTRP